MVIMQILLLNEVNRLLYSFSVDGKGYPVANQLDIIPTVWSLIKRSEGVASLPNPISDAPPRSYLNPIEDNSSIFSFFEGANFVAEDNATLLFIRVHIFVESGSQRKENHENVLFLKHLAFAAAKFVVEAMSMSIYIDMFCPMSFLVYVL